MSKSRIDVDGLYAALDAARHERQSSWRQLAAQIGVSPSLMSRMANGLRPDADGFMTLTRWLNVPAEQFTLSDDQVLAAGTSDGPTLAVQLAPLLRASADLQPEDVKMLQEVINATVRRARAVRKHQ